METASGFHSIHTLFVGFETTALNRVIPKDSFYVHKRQSKLGSATLTALRIQYIQTGFDFFVKYR